MDRVCTRLGRHVGGLRAGRMPGDLRGFTLLELLVTMMIASVLAAIAVPSFTSFVQNQRLSTQAEALVSSLNYARSEAIKADSNISVCASADGATCTGSWAQGWIVTNPAAVAPSPQLLRVLPALTGGNTLSVTPATGTVTFSSNGQASAAVAFHLCDSRGASDGRDVEVNNLGRIEAAQTPGQNLDGSALAC